MKSAFDLCALCLEPNHLCNSHILPEFLYREIYDDKHRLHLLSAKNARAHRRFQKGIREHLLCESCETHLSQVERYVNLVFTGEIAVAGSHTENLIEIKGLDYDKFRLFGLSILWRASVSKQRFFRGVKLGPHEERIRLMVRNSNPGEPLQYPFMLSPLVVKDEAAPDLIVEPTKCRMASHRCYRFVFGHLIWLFIVTGHAIPERLREAFISKNGRMLMLESNLDDVDFIKQPLVKALRLKESRWRIQS